MKTTVKCRIVCVAILSLLVGLGACENEQMSTENDDNVSILKVAGDGTTSVIEPNLLSVLIEAPAISGEEMSALLEMKEEEKLARDVYTFLYTKWGNRIFYNISLAEERHMNAVILLLKFYDSPDTLIGDAGIFTKLEFQTLYNDLTTAGSVSVEKAYETGAMIEEMDIKDLSEKLNVVTNSNIILVFENLLKGSRNHLRAFIRQLTNLGVIYTPAYISEEEFQEIISSPMETGNQYRMNRYGRQGRHGNNGGQNGLNGNGKGH